jgi:DNA-binding XRE family transcriptional regulator
VVVANTRDFSKVIRAELAANPSLAVDVMFASVATELIAARQAAGLTQRELAKRAGLHQSAVSKIEGADSVLRGLKTLARLAQVLGLELCVVLKPAPRK